MIPDIIHLLGNPFFEYDIFNEVKFLYESLVRK